MLQNEHLTLGRINCLRIDRHTPHGIFLESLDEKDVLLPQSYVTNEMQDDTLLEVFLYTDSEDRLIATTLKPKAMLDEFALFEVVDVAPFGAFVNWGLAKDLFVPNMFQKERFKIGDKRFLKVVYDEKTHRLVGTEKLGNIFDKKPKGIVPHKEVDITIITKTPLGFKCLVEGKYEGLIYHNEIFEKIDIGNQKKAHVKTIRKDGCIDLSLQAGGVKQKDVSCQKVLSLLKQNAGAMPYNYKSDPELIQNVFGLSKKAYKRSLTALQDSGEIEVKDSGIYLKN
ncbi:MAG: DNA-binding protein [Sulfurimonas sp. RIFOXYD12_FULL_33_39]|uniref:CvfB family protein n=1 Tax=unclassified Sulfurimonas TaxID=2623549 RepID=UPI0008C0712B|nr:MULTISPECIES: S1-like domain-containing RNA-binding protein [unclassified Sulfurimonas]OHE03077.1 MAG: DNA-binding protein [Sulfurimonas sp. RIFCSPLOWO2_12_FULL_34_6]OHE10386.1 MAG: DNA-binding protein [Sulfurimonas sp. RIFOXYD12_FULL_33_39]OHE14843.1 MAG: DNA-binding protein [Sulfurimonas sp. RIFOXYD2_FULL_34_21]DAB28514.1 MAG TPA: DNA-binding protein [Sulfurimonas sp. UBA10385]